MTVPNTAQYYAAPLGERGETRLVGTASTPTPTAVGIEQASSRMVVLVYNYLLSLPTLIFVDKGISF